jgi:hypothetical protein
MDEHQQQTKTAEQIVHWAWSSLPAANRRLLEAIGASQWQVVSGPLGAALNDLLCSAGLGGLSGGAILETDGAFGVWEPRLRVVLIRAEDPRLEGVDAATREEFLARVAWHEWGHALGVVRCEPADVARGRELLELSPAGIRERIRLAGYPVSQYTHEIVAETYALLLLRRVRGGSGQPRWLNNEIYRLLIETTNWID